MKTKYYYLNNKTTNSYDTLSYDNNACIEIIEDNKNPFDGNSENNNESNEEKSNLEKTVTVESDPKLDDDKTVEHISEENE